MINLQHTLAGLTSRVSGSSSSKVHLAFSIVTEGPYFELWVHYTTLEDGVRVYNMNILAIGHASLYPTVLEFLILVDKVMSWATSDFLNDIADQLILLGKGWKGGVS